ncbi:MAG: glycosyltransferase [Nostocaceae cyanobacterium]|nr:glycosyltransferase [Nostocaceae cyanobacterium]
MPSISVVIPAYNAERTILETIASVQQQTFSDFELIVINDGSIDRTLELLNSVEDSRLNIFSYSNGGLPTARNRGISRASGEFIAFLDADDLWTPDKLELQVEALQQHPDAGVAYSWTSFMEEKEGSLSFKPCEPVFFQGNVYANLLVGDFIYNGSNTLIRKQAIESTGEFEPTLKSCEDWDYWLRLAARWHFVVVPKYQILYRRSSGAMSSKVEVMKQACLIVLEKAYQAAPSEVQYLKNQSFTSFHKYCADLYLKHSSDMNGVKEAGQHLWMAIRLQPQTLLNKRFQKLILKFILLRIFSPVITNNFLQLFNKIRANRQPLVQ